MAQDVDLTREVANTEYESWEQDQNANGQPPFQIEEEPYATNNAYEIGDNVNYGA